MGETSAQPAAWRAASDDPVLASPVHPGTAPVTPAGKDLDLRMGWDRFEAFTLTLFRRVWGARDVRYRRYGVQGQAQHGIDLAGREPDGSYIVIQCKDYTEFTPADLRAAVETFAAGKRPFDAKTLIVVTSASTQRTELADELDDLQFENRDLNIDLWGSEDINEELRYRADIVARFWTHETAKTFCTGAPPPGVAAPPLDRQQQAERILVGPLHTADAAPALREAEELAESDPRGAVARFGHVADRLEVAGFRGHAFVLRRRQLDVLTSASLSDETVRLAGELACGLLLRGERDPVRELNRLMRDQIGAPAIGALPGFAEVSPGAQSGESREPEGAAEPSADPSANSEGHTSQAERDRRRHVQLIDAAVNDLLHPLGVSDRLSAALPSVAGVSDPDYHYLLVLEFAEKLLAFSPLELPNCDFLILEALERAKRIDAHSDATLRLRLVRAEYDLAERISLKTAARRHQLPARASALVSAREARRCSLEGRPEEAIDSWRDAVGDGIEAGLNDDAADWLYSIRALNVRYGPWSLDLDDEHRLAQAIRATSASTLLTRPRGPRESAMAALVGSKPIESVLSAQRWLIDACVTGAWSDELEAAEFLANRYADNSEPDLAAQLYHRAGSIKRLDALIARVGDKLLPVDSWESQPWWVVNAQVRQMAQQEDLVDAPTASKTLDSLIELAERGRAGEIVESPQRSLWLSASLAACDLAHRGNTEQAQSVLDMFADDVPREPGHYALTDKNHASACLRIAINHPILANQALHRLVDLAAVDAQEAQQLLVGDEVIALITGTDSGGTLPLNYADSMAASERADLVARIVSLATDERYLADVAMERVAPEHPLVQERALAARDRVLARPEPDPSVTTLGTALRKDAYLASLLPGPESRPCLEKLMEIASDPRESAFARRDALTGARDIAVDQDSMVKTNISSRAKSFVDGDQDGSHLDDFTGKSHPLSAFKFESGSVSLRGPGLRLVLAATDVDDTAELSWILERSKTLLASEDREDVHAAAIVIHKLPSDLSGTIDATFLAGHQAPIARQVAVRIAIASPERYANVLLRLARDSSPAVRRGLAECIVRHTGDELVPPLVAAQEVLAGDPRHSIRRIIKP